MPFIAGNQETWYSRPSEPMKRFEVPYRLKFAATDSNFRDHAIGQPSFLGRCSIPVVTSSRPTAKAVTTHHRAPSLLAPWSERLDGLDQAQRHRPENGGRSFALAFKRDLALQP